MLNRFQFILCLLCILLLAHSISFSQATVPTLFLKKQFNPSGMAINPFCITASRANGYLIAADYYIPSTKTSEPKTTCLIRIDENGCVTWSKSLESGEVEVIQAMIATSDSGFLISAFPYQPQTANYPRSLVIFKIDKQGNIKWSNNYGSGSSVINYLSAICETTDHGYLFEAGSFPADNNSSFLSIIKLNEQGAVIWASALGMEKNAFYNVGGVLEKNGYMYASGSMNQSASPFQFIRSFLTKMDLASGQVIWAKQNDPNQGAVNFTDLHAYRNGILINSYDTHLLNILIYADDDGNIKNANTVNNPYGPINGKGNVVVAQNNVLYFHQSSGAANNSRKEIIMRADSNLQIQWQHDYFEQDLRFDSWNQLTPAPSGGVASLGNGTTAEGLKAVTFLRLDSYGTLCNSGNTDLTITGIHFSFVPMNWALSSNLPVNISALSQPMTDMSIDARLFCPKYITGCDTLKLEGPGIVCNLRDTATFLLRKDPACMDAVTWTFDTSYIFILEKNASGVMMKFNKEGTYTIKAETRGCNVVTDSVQVIVGNGNGKHLPVDTTLCIGEPLLLDAGSGYESYQWQDGSQQQSIQVTVPGEYWVRLVSMNGCIHTDTTAIGPIASLPADFLPADTVFCTYAPLIVQPVRSFKTYLWNTGDTTAFIQIVNEGMYTLHVTDQNGCAGSDTIRVGTKICPQGIYFPNAFTPNKDGLNDQFRPIVRGVPVLYRFSIYNRFGQRVFETTDTKKGWDGTVDGTVQQTAVFAWSCTYQFNGEREMNQWGSVVLVR
jgi:gliding motility-associated-like protein